MESQKYIEATMVHAVVIDKKKNKSLLKILFGFGTPAGVFCKVKNPETGKEFIDFMRVTMEGYAQAQIGDELSLIAYKGIKNSDKIYLKIDEALFQ